MNEKELFDYVKNIKMDLTKKGYPVGNITKYSLLKSKKIYGRCCRSRNKTDNSLVFEIKLNEYFLKTKKETCLETILHELIHTFPGCFNHLSGFQKHAKEINFKYGTNIGTHVSKETSEKFKNIIPSKYIIVCLKCGKLMKFNRKNSLINELYLGLNISRYHNKCKGSEFWLIKYNDKDVSQKFILSKGLVEQNIPKKLLKEYLKTSEKATYKKVANKEPFETQKIKPLQLSLDL